MLASTRPAYRKAISFLLLLIMTISWLSVPSSAYATGESISTSSGATVYAAGSGASVIDSSLVISGSDLNTSISSAKVYLSSGFDSSDDALIYPTKIGNITGSYNSTDGVLILSGTDTLTNYQLALRSIQYQNTDTTATGERSIVFSIETSSMYTLGDHYYEVVYNSSTITWKNAKAAAAARSYNGMAGYLATITSQAENDFLDQKVNADAWIGASDDYDEINAVTGTAFTAQGVAYSATSTESEGKWYWVTGPEKGTLLSIGNYINSNSNVTTISGVYSNWASGEPNNLGSEHYAHMLSSGGQWNDYPNSLSVHYYIVEYSTTGAIVSPLISTKSLQIVQPGVVSLSASASTIAESAGTSTLTATLSSATNQAVTVDLSFGGTATANSDYTSSGAVITIPAGSTSGSVTLTGVDDFADEPDETILVDIAGVTNAAENGTQQVTVTLTDDDIPSLSISSPSIEEGNEGEQVLNFVVTLSPAAFQSVTVQYATTKGGTATEGTDYISTNGGLTFAPGVTSKSISVSINGDVALESDETIVIQLFDVNSAATIISSLGTGTINDNDTPLPFDASFETGIGSWTIKAGSMSGTKTINADDNVWVIQPNGTTMAALQPAGSISKNTVYNTLGLSTSSISYIDSQFGNSTNFAYMYRTVQLSAGQTMTLAWNYTSIDYVPFNDGSFVAMVNLDQQNSFPVINGVKAEVSILGATNPGTGNYSTGSYGSTGWQTVTIKAETAGLYRIGFAVFNLSDTALSPCLTVDNAPGITMKNGTTFGAIAPDTSAPPPAGEVTSFTVTYIGNGNTSGNVPVDSNVYDLNDSAVVLGNSGNLQKTGFHFAGWSKSTTGAGTTYTSGASVTSAAASVTLFAKWTAEPVITVPGAPTQISAVAGNGEAFVSFDPPSSSGGAVITGYIVTASPGGLTASGIASPITLTGLTNGVGYTFSVLAVNSAGSSTVSSQSALVTPVAPTTRSRSIDPNAVTSTINGQSVQIGTRTTETNGEQTQTVLNVNPTAISNLANTMFQGSTLVLPTYTGTANGTGNGVADSSIDGTKVGMTLGLVDQLFHQDIALQIDTGQIAYTLPANSIDIPTLLTKFEGNVPESQVTFDITISDVPTKMLEVVQNTAVKDEFAIVIPPVEFNVTATYNGQTVSVNHFSQHVSREIALPAGTDPKKITTAIVVKEDGTTYHVPTDVYLKDGQWYARISSLNNSVYTLIYNEATFADTKGRWFEAPVAEAASRTILNGYADGTFRGTNPITRAEFAAMIVNTLGLDRVGTSNYSDVKDSNWFYGVVSRASEYKVVSGRLDGSFDPNAYITRQEAMTMMQRAGEICGLVPGEGNAAATLSSGYVDQAAISTWAKEAVEYNLKFGLMKGSNGQLKPRDNITRAEAAVTILRLLQKSHLIDPRSAV